LLRVMLEADESCNSSRLANVAYHICASAQDLAGTRGSFLEILDCAFGGLLTPDGDLLQKE